MEIQSNRKYLLIFSSILIGYKYFGLVIDGSIPYTQIKFSSQSSIQLALALFVLFFGVQYTYSAIKQERKERKVFDIILVSAIALAAIIPVGYEYLVKFGIDWKVICSVFVVAILGFPWVIACDFLITIPFSIRSADDMERRGLDKIPSASKAFIRCLFFLIPLAILITYLTFSYSHKLSAPINEYWYIIFIAPAILFNFDQFLNLLMCLGPKKIRQKGLNNLRKFHKAMDVHEMHYQYIGIEKMKEHELPLICQLARAGDLLELENLLNIGEDPNTQDSRGWSPLMWATAEGHLPFVVLLLDHGADPNLTNFLGRSAIMYASNYGFSEIAELLLKEGAIPNPSRDFSQHPPLSAAAHRGHLKVVELLVEHNADLFYKNKENETALDIAMKAGHGEIAKYLRKKMQELNDTLDQDKVDPIKNLSWVKREK